MPILNWIGKEKIVNHDKDVPFRLLRKNKKYSLGNSENLILEGDNLEALKALMPFYYGKIKCIYIDPPYNTGNEKWVYNDRVNSPKIKEWLGKVVGPEGDDLCRHDKWLCMMYPRLRLLQDLLSDDGVIFVSIDENELNNLLFILDEVFDNNKIGIFTWVRKKKGSHLSVSLRKMTEYICAYSKGLKQISLYGEKAYVDKWQPLVKRTNNEKILIILKGKIETKLEDGRYGAKKYGTEGTSLFFNTPIIVKSGIVINEIRVKGRFVWSQDMINNELDLGTRISLSGKFGFNVLRYDQADKFKRPSTLLNEEFGVGTNEDAAQELANIFGKEIGKAFEFPKPTSLVKYLIQTVTNETKDSIILDSFAGSGTTAHAVLDLNKEDGGNRKFILVEMEKNIAKNITAERVKRVARGYSYKTGNGKAVKVSGLGGGFEYVELGEPLFDKDGTISKAVTFEDMARYVYFTETRTNLEKKNIKGNYLGEFGSSHYFLLFDGIGENILNRKFLKELKGMTGPAVAKAMAGKRKIIYADKCLLGDEILEKHHIVFKQIPYQVKIY